MSYTMREYDVKIIKNKLKGYTSEESARLLGLTYRTVQRRLKRWREMWPSLREILLEIESNEDVKAFLSGETTREKPNVRWMERQYKKGYHHSPAPYGYTKVGDRLVQVPDEAAVVKQIFEGIDRGKTLWELAKELAEIGLTYYHVHKISHNVVYKGWVRLVRHTKRGRHEAIVSEKLWDRVQKKIGSGRQFGDLMLPYGFKYKDGLVVIDDEKAEDIRKMFRLRKDGGNFVYIGKELGWLPGTVRYRIKNPRYCGMKRRNGKLVKSGLPGIVSLSDWNEANAVEMSPAYAADETKKKKIVKNQNKILASLGRSVKTAPQISRDTRLPRTTVLRHLEQLKESKRVKKVPPEQDKIQGRYQPAKWQIQTE